MEVEYDPVTGRHTTGHEWNGIKELDTPIPAIVKWCYGLTILFSIIWWILYPSWPYVSDFMRGIAGYSSRHVVTTQLQDATAQRAVFDSDLLKGSLVTLAADPDARKKYEASAKILYRDNCAACHGRDLRGQNGFPNLTDPHWLWSGDVEDIATTLRVGINSGHDDERSAEMPAFGRDDVIEKADIDAVIAYVLFISGQNHDATLRTKGEAVFAENCASCHGEKGVGGLGAGAPSLVDQAWIYGKSRAMIHQAIWQGRKGVMPGWTGRLTETEIRKLALYVTWQNDAGNK